MTIEFAESDEDIRSCCRVMAQLRPHLQAKEFVAQVKRQTTEGYRLVRLEGDNEVRAVAGFRIGEMLHRGRYLYVDDLVTDAAARSQGYGDALFDWLVNHAKEQNCHEFHLDSGVQRFDAHRFYFRKRMKISSYHFALDLRNNA